MIGWNFALKNEQGRDLVDTFLDSKFGINKFASFSREIIQNSLDALDTDNYKTVIMNFEFVNLKTSDIPGSAKIISVLENCIISTEHSDTIDKYKKALEILKSNCIPCLKVSDYNTNGMYSSNWDALINKLGASAKNNSDSAGRHGVGKKASFLLSLCNTVFYSSKNKDNELRFGGKTVLIDWEEDGKFYSANGWYGNIQKSNDTSIVEPITENNQEINKFFFRNDRVGSDIIIIALIEEDEMEKSIIDSVLENFFVGIVEEKLIVNVNGTEINKNTISKIIDKNYNIKFSKKTMNSDNIVVGLLKDYDKAYRKGKLHTIEINNPKGYIDIYYTLETIENRKYYSFFRNHGMKIRDFNLSTDKSYAAVVVVRGEELNKFLLSIETTAHDDFVIDKTNPDYSNVNKKLSMIYEYINYFLKDISKIETSDTFYLHELNEMVTYLGDISKTKKSENRKVQQNQLKSLVQKKSNKNVVPKWTEEYDPFDVKDGGIKSKRKKKNKRPLPIKTEGDNIKDNEDDIVQILEYQKCFVVIQNSYSIKFSLDIPLKNVKLTLLAKNVDDTYNDVTNRIEKISIQGIDYKKEMEFISIKKIPSDTDININVNLINNSRYKLFVKIQGVSDED